MRFDRGNRRGDTIGAMSDDGDDDEVPRPAPPPLGRGVEERWTRRTREPDVRSVSTIKRAGAEWPWTKEWPWSVYIAAAEFAREEPLEGDLRRAVTTGLQSVPGVTKVVQEDREKWIVGGTPSGEALVKAAAAAVDGLADRIRAHIEALAARS